MSCFEIRWKHVVAMSVFCMLALACYGCGNPIAAARNSVATAAKIQKDTLEQFVAWDKAHQKQLLDDTPNKADYEVAIAKYRVDRQKVVVGFKSLWAASIATETAANLAEAGMKNPKDLAGYVTALMGSLHDLIEALRLVGLPTGGL